jgi:hypothetical protein
MLLEQSVYLLKQLNHKYWKKKCEWGLLKEFVGFEFLSTVTLKTVKAYIVHRRALGRKHYTHKWQEEFCSIQLFVENNIYKHFEKLKCLILETGWELVTKRRELLKQMKLLLSCRTVCSVNRKELCKSLCFDGLRQKAAVKVFTR